MTNTNDNMKWAVEILEENMSGYTQEEKKNYLEDVTQHGCVSGCVSGVIYYSETKKLFQDNLEEILEVAAEYTLETDHNIVSYLAEKEGVESLYNYLVWFVVEYAASELLRQYEEEEELI